MHQNFMTEELINVFVEWVKENKDKVTYDWPVSEEAISKLSQFQIPIQQCQNKEETLALKTALKVQWDKFQTEQKVDLAEWVVRDWGRVKSNSRSRIREYVDLIEKGKEPELFGVSSWSKIMAIALPEKSAIYDSRVSAALTAIQIEKGVKQGVLFSSIPSENKSVKPFQKVYTTKKLTQQLGWKSIPKNKTFAVYVSLLQDVANRVRDMSITELEMLLFAKAPIICRKLTAKTVPPLVDRMHHDYVLGSLLGGAIGDALGAPIEFQKLAYIREKFGQSGLKEFQEHNGLNAGSITDHTQMVLFTAEGLIRSRVRGELKGICDPKSVIHNAYMRWLKTQSETGNMELELDGYIFEVVKKQGQREPGNTCLSALKNSRSLGEFAKNERKGCGTVMRVAPIGLMDVSPFDLASETAALTHGHPTAQISAGALAELLQLLKTQSLKQAISRMLLKVKKEEVKRRVTPETSNLLERAIELASCFKQITPEIVEQLGGGWIAEEALAIGILCSMTAESYEQGVLNAINHSGDSDSTGAITGNILGAVYGASALPKHWVKKVEARRHIEFITEALIQSYSEGFDEAQAIELAADFPGS